jgi:hypothetical protein
MLTQLKRLLVPVFALSLTAGGLAYAATGHSFGLDIAGRTSDETAALGADAQSSLELGDTDDPTGSSPTTPTARSTEGCPAGFDGNHGQFVSSTEDTPRNEAAHSPCGKPVQAVDHPTGETEGPEGDEAEVGENENENEDEAETETETEHSDQGSEHSENAHSGGEHGNSDDHD